MSRTQLEEWVGLVGELPALVDEGWLETEVQRVAEEIAADTSGGRRERHPRHPLAELTHQVRGELHRWGSPGFRPSAGLARLGMLAFSIRTLREAQVEGLDERVALLTNSGDELFESTRFELAVANLYVLAGRKVRFIPEVHERRTPDLEVDNTVEVECKRKMELSGPDRAMRDAWGLLERRLLAVLPSSGSYSVEFSTRAAPTRGDVDWALAETRRVLNESTSDVSVRISDDEGGRELRLCTLEVTDDGAVMPEDARPLEDFNVGKMEMTGLLTPTGVQNRRAVRLGFRTDVQKDWVKGVRSSIRSARDQFSGERPAVVFVEVTASAVISALHEKPLAPLKAVVDDVFRNSSRLSAVVIAVTGWLTDESGQGEAVAQYHAERNPQARHPLHHTIW